jgi:hypothetical protein
MMLCSLLQANHILEEHVTSTLKVSAKHVYSIILAPLLVTSSS